MTSKDKIATPTTFSKVDIGCESKMTAGGPFGGTFHTCDERLTLDFRLLFEKSTQAANPFCGIHFRHTPACV